MKRQAIESVALSLKVLLWLIGVPAVLATILLLLAMWDSVGELWGHSHVVVVAKMELTAGTIITTNNLARKEFKCTELASDDWVARGDAEVLLGHRLLSDLKKGQPIEWRNTDIVITNDVSPQESAASDAGTHAPAP